MRLLVAEDELRMRELLAELLSREDYDVDTAKDGTETYDKLQKEAYDLVVLDVMMPGMSGFEVAEKARADGIETPILILSAKGEPYDKVHGLDCGADDYMAKPFTSDELLARIRALLRRFRPDPGEKLNFGDIALRPELKTVECTRTGQGVRLSDKEYNILALMISNGENVSTKDQLLQKIWGDDDSADYNNVEVYMTFTRKKLAFINAETKIKSVRGQGYILRSEDA